MPFRIRQVLCSCKSFLRYHGTDQPSVQLTDNLCPVPASLLSVLPVTPSYLPHPFLFVGNKKRQKSTCFSTFLPIKNTVFINFLTKPVSVFPRFYNHSAKNPHPVSYPGYLILRKYARRGPPVFIWSDHRDLTLPLPLHQKRYSGFTSSLKVFLS